MPIKKYLPLHIKTALLASLISLALLIIGLMVISASIAKQIQNEQKQLVVLASENLAERLSSAQITLNEQALQDVANILSSSRPNLVTVRVWYFENGKFVEGVASDDSLPIEEVGDDVQAALQKGVGTTSIRSLQNENKSLFRVFSPIVRQRQVTGAVEAVEELDTISSIAVRYASSLSWIMLATVVFMAIAFYLLFQRLVYQPLGYLLAAMEKAESGNLTAEVSGEKNEFGELVNGFNSMMSQIREMTSERTRQNEILQEKVSAATLELTEKNTQLETANLELFRATRQMSEMERLAAAGQTAAQFAHEVGTPLNLISGHVQLLQGTLPEGGKEAGRLQTISIQIERIEKIVREMLDRTRFGKSDRSPINLNEVLQKIIDAIEPILEDNKIELELSLEKDLPQIAGDADRLQQVFLNLIKNSLDAMPTGGILRIKTISSERKAFVELSDNGTGMSEETKARIFHPLFTTKERGRGTGLGLVVVQQITQEHGAEITVESEPGKGTGFKLTFPAVTPSENNLTPNDSNP